MNTSEDKQNKNKAPAKKKSGFFTFLFNPEKFVEDFEEEPIEVSPTAQAYQLTTQTTTQPLSDPAIKTNGQNNGADSNGRPVLETAASILVAPPTAESDGDLANETGFSNYLNKFTYYALLQLKSDAEQTAIHKQYLRRMRSILKIDSEERELEPWQFQRLLLMINIAHQVLNDPATREGYDQSLLQNSNGGSNLQSTARAGRLIDIIELIRIFKILGPQTQQIVAKAIAERNGASDHELANRFVEEGLLSEEDLESIVLACYLLATGKVNMSQLELVLDEIKQSKSLLWVSLVAKGWVKMSDLS